MENNNELYTYLGKFDLFPPCIYFNKENCEDPKKAALDFLGIIIEMGKTAVVYKGTEDFYVVEFCTDDKEEKRRPLWVVGVLMTEDEYLEQYRL